MKKILFFGKNHFRYYSLLALLILPLLNVSAQVSLTTMGAAYTQDFNTLASSGTSSVVPTGWAFQETGGNTLYSAGTGSVSSGDTYSFGALLAADRAFGTLLSGSVTSTLGVSFTNNTGSTITSLDISYIGEQWRLGTASRTDQLNFEYSLNATSLTSGSWTSVSALNFITPNTSTVVGAVNGNVTGNRTSISSTISSLSIASGATVWIRWTDFNASGADDGLGIDDFSLTPNGAAAAPTKLAITSVNPASPIAGNAFSITVQAQDGSNVPQNVSANTAFTLSTNGNAGTLGGTLTGTIIAGQNSVVVSGLTLPSAGTGVNLTATRTSGDVLTAGTSANFAVVGVATKVVFVGVPSTGFTSSNLTTFTVEAQRADNSVDVNYNGSITVSKASGPGTLSGTTSTTAVNGIATFSDLQFDQVGTYALSASSGTLSPSTSSSIIISQSPVTWNFGTSTGLASPSSGTPYANLTVSNILQGNSNGATTMLTSSTASSGYTGASGNFNAGVAARVGAINTAANGSAYFEFSLTPDPGYYVTLNGISFGSRSTGTGPAAFSVRSSNDNYASNLGTGTLSTGSSWALLSPSFSSASSTAGNVITFRIYGHSGSGSPSAGTANWKIDDVVLNLNVQQCSAPSIAVNSGAICTGNSFTITPTGGVSYTVTGGNFNVSPTINTNYTVTGADIHGCTNTAVSSVTVNSLPTVSVNANPTAICSGSSSTLTASGAISYLWNTGETTAAITVSPTGTTGYTVTGVDGNGCSNMDMVSITVNALPSVSVTASSATICSGSSSTLTASGATSYLWNTGETTTAIAVSPTGATSYTVTGVDGNGCSNTDVVSITVNALPSVSINASSASICSGTSATLTANGAVSYLWNTGATTSVVSVSPTGNTSYTVTGTDGNGCSDIAVQTITVTACSTTTVPCGKTFNNMLLTSLSGGNSTSAGNVTGAVSYRFNFYDNTTNALVGTKTQASRTCTFSTIPGIYYGNTYKWSVAVDKGTGFGPESTPCPVTFGLPQTSVPCGSTYTNLFAYTTCQAVGKATSYRFTFYNNTTNAVVATKVQASNYLYFNTISGLAYGNTYKYTVEAQYDDGTGNLVYGPASSNLCTISFAPPVTTVPCGFTYEKSGYSSATQISGATGYRWSFYDATTMTLVATKTNTTSSPYVYFNQVTGLTFNKAYRWTVEVQYNNGTGLVFGPPSSTTCAMNYGTPSSFITNDDNSGISARTTQVTTEGDEDTAVMNVYPNPTKDKINVTANTAIKAIKVYNIAGELVLSAEWTDEVNMSDLKPGLYSVSIETESNTKHFKIIKE